MLFFNLHLSEQLECKKYLLKINENFFVFLYSWHVRLMLWNQISCLGVTLDSALNSRLSASPLETFEEEKHNNRTAITATTSSRLDAAAVSQHLTYTATASSTSSVFREKKGRKKQTNLRVLGNNSFWASRWCLWNVIRITDGPMRRDRSSDGWLQQRCGLTAAKERDNVTERERWCCCCHSTTNKSASYCYADEKRRVAVSEDGSNHTANLSFGIIRFRPLDHSTWLEPLRWWWWWVDVGVSSDPPR